MPLPNPLRHLEAHGERNLDTSTLRQLLDGACRWLGHYVADLAICTADHLRNEMQALFAEEEQEHLTAVHRIRAELTRRGVTQMAPHTLISS